MATSLAHLAEIERLSPICIRILGLNPGKFTLQGTNTYLLGNGRNRILVDTGQGEAGWITNLKAVLDTESAVVETALITHWHADHQGGIQHLRELCPRVAVYKNDPETGQQSVDDGQMFSTDGVTLQAFHTPGHTKDHMVFRLTEEDAVFSGDNVLGQGTAVFEDLSAYIASLKRMQSIFKGRIYPGHGPVLVDGPSKIVEYIRHRQQREDQVVQCLKSSKSGDPAGLVKIIYADVPQNLHAAAQRGIIQILEKLEREGRVAQDADKWSLKRSAL